MSMFIIHVSLETANNQLSWIGILHLFPLFSPFFSPLICSVPFCSILLKSTICYSLYFGRHVFSNLPSSFVISQVKVVTFATVRSNDSSDMDNTRFKLIQILLFRRKRYNAVLTLISPFYCFDLLKVTIL